MAIYTLRIIFFVAILWETGAVASCLSSESLDIKQQCLGCHSTARDVPRDRFPDGIAHWHDYQCFGCHSELNAVSKLYVGKVKDKRIMQLPFTNEHWKRWSEQPLSYEATPQELIFEVGSVKRFDMDRLTTYVQRNIPSGRNTFRMGQMPSFPSFKKSDLTCIAADSVLGVKKANEEMAPQLEPEQPATIPNGKTLWEAHCVTCHLVGGSGPKAEYLAIFSSEWIYHYTNTATSIQAVRTMPQFKLTKAEAAAIFTHLGQEQNALLTRVDKAVDQMKAQPLPRLKEDAGRDAYMKTQFWRDGLCVHCHSGEAPAAKAFTASHQGMQIYGKPKELAWRLLTREIEIKLGASAKEPGMPMSHSAFPQLHYIIGAP